MLKIFTELRVSVTLVFCQKHIFEERYSIYSTGSTIQRKADKV